MTRNQSTQEDLNAIETQTFFLCGTSILIGCTLPLQYMRHAIYAYRSFLQALPHCS